MRTVRLAACLLSVGCTPTGFACMDDAQCGASGTCEPEGWCSFPDDACPDGHRFGAHAGDGLGGTCVPPRGDTGSGGTSSSTTIAPTTSLEASSLGSSGNDESSTTAIAASSESSTGKPAESSTGETGDPDLLLWLDFDDVTAPWADASGHGNDATCVRGQCPLVEDGTIGLAARFDGVDDHLVVTTAGGLAMPTAFTLALWVEADVIADGEYNDVLTRAYGEATLNSWGLGFPPVSPAMHLVVYDGIDQQVGGIASWPGDIGWHHVAATWDGMATSVYLDGAPMGMAVPIATVLLDDHPVLVGADLEAGLVVNFFAGALDDIRVYARALDEDEIAALVGN